MQGRYRITLTALALGVIVLTMGAFSFAQDKPQVFQATARGTGDQLGREAGVEITINSFSSPDDHQVLVDAFLKKGNQGLVDALKKMPVRGKLWFSGEVPYDITYVKEILTPDGGRVIRLVTNRFVTLPETGGRAQWASDYNLSALELTLSPDKGKSTGVFAPACQFTMSKEKGVQIETYRNPWTLVWITEKTGK